MTRRVFISYSHDSEEHKERVHQLADRLRADGMTVIIDRDMLPGGPAKGWPKWSEGQVVDADFVLVATTQTYCQRYELDKVTDPGLGAVCEAHAIRQLLYDVGGINEKFRVILFLDEDNNHVPIQLKGYHRFQLYQQENGYDDLLAWLQPAPVPAPSAGQEITISWPAPIPDYVWPLADRKPEFSLFERIVTGHLPQRILLVQGVSNTGKTVLSAELSAYAQSLGLRTASLDFKGCPSLDDLFQILLLNLGRDILRKTREADQRKRPYQLIEDLQELQVPLLLVFDTYEQASEDARRWLESQLLPQLKQAPGVVIFIGGQQIPEYNKHSWKALTEARTLEPILQVDYWLEYSHGTLQCLSVNSDHVQALTLATGGNPGQISALLAAMVQGLLANPDE